jgi:hypothetical protein
MGNENLHILLGACMGEIDPAMKFGPQGPQPRCCDLFMNG